MLGREYQSNSPSPDACCRNEKDQFEVGKQVHAKRRLYDPQERKMSDNIIVATFNSTNAAYDAASAIKALKNDDLTKFNLKSGVMVKKDDKGNVSLVEDRTRPFVGTVVGTAVGALIGLIGGAPGVAMGAALGATTGLSGDVVTGALSSDFVDSVTTEMRPEMTAVIVEADEGSTVAVDGIVALGNGHVYRQAA
jgi:uncharacterized membrane protein